MTDSAPDPQDAEPRDKLAPPDQKVAKDGEAQPDGRTAPRDEKDLWTGRASAKFFLGQWVLWIIGAIVLLVVGIFACGWVDAGWPVWAALGLIALWFLLVLGKVGYRILVRRNRVTTQRLFVEEGILIRTINQTDLIRVNDVSVTQKLLDRVFNVGSVTVECPSDASHPKILIFGVHDPHQVAEHIHREMRSLRDRKSLVMEAT